MTTKHPLFTPADMLQKHATGTLLAGVDEAGRGPLAGPVVAAAVILPANYDLPGLTDSKQMTAKRRLHLYSAIKQQAQAFAIAEASVAEIDQYNIFQATLLAMQRAVNALPIQPVTVYVDGKFCPPLAMPAHAIIKGDEYIPSISAASILAKVDRDAIMTELDKQFPGYDFARHKGYPTALHKKALEHLGPSPCHRMSFAPVKNARSHMT